MKLIISNVSGVPIYEQIKQQIKAAILSGELQAEETLPSLRDRKSTRLNSSHPLSSRMPSSA